MEWFQCLTGACPEPRQLANVGLFLDMIGAVLVAATAWLRLKTPGRTGVDVDGFTYVPGADEAPRPLWVRRGFVVLGGLLLVIGFAFQIRANDLQWTKTTASAEARVGDTNQVTTHDPKRTFRDCTI